MLKGSNFVITEWFVLKTFHFFVHNKIFVFANAIKFFESHRFKMGWSGRTNKQYFILGLTAFLSVKINEI